MAYLRAKAAEADKIAERFKKRALDHTKAGFTEVRDFCDVQTISEMTAYQLDNLAEMVLRRLAA